MIYWRREDYLSYGVVFDFGQFPIKWDEKTRRVRTKRVKIIVVWGILNSPSRVDSILFGRNRK